GRSEPAGAVFGGDKGVDRVCGGRRAGGNSWPYDGLEDPEVRRRLAATAPHGHRNSAAYQQGGREPARAFPLNRRSEKGAGTYLHWVAATLTGRRSSDVDRNRDRRLLYHM